MNDWSAPNLYYYGVSTYISSTDIISVGSLHHIVGTALLNSTADDSLESYRLIIFIRKLTLLLALNLVDNAFSERE